MSADLDSSARGSGQRRTTILVVGKGVGWWEWCRDGKAYDYAPNYRFVSDPSCTDYDWLVVYDELKDPLDVRCPRERTILALDEPVSIKSYSQAYCRQFGHLLTNRPWEAERHPHYHQGRGHYMWFVGRTPQEVDAAVLPPKERLVSAICSSKQMRHTRHQARFRLMETLAREIPGLDWFGKGVRTFGKKYEVSDPYKYQVVVENHIAPHHWSEKIADAFLCECLPFYAGAPDLSDDFPKESFIPIPIDDPGEAVRIVRQAIAAGAYESRREAVLEAKRLVREKYNFWAQVIGIVESEAQQATTPVDPARPVTLYPRKTLRRRSLSAALEDGWFHLRQYLKIW